MGTRTISIFSSPVKQSNRGKCLMCDSDQYEILDKGEPGVDGWGTPIRQCRICSTIYQRRDM